MFAIGIDHPNIPACKVEPIKCCGAIMFEKKIFQADGVGVGIDCYDLESEMTAEAERTEMVGKQQGSDGSPPPGEREGYKGHREKQSGKIRIIPPQPKIPSGDMLKIPEAPVEGLKRNWYIK